MKQMESHHPKKGLYSPGCTKPQYRSSLADEQLLKDEKDTRPLIVIYRLRFMEHKQAINLLTPF